MKPISLFLSLLFLFIFPTKLFAQENWTINSFDSKVVVLASGKVAVTETIEADFGSLQKHGIFRDVPFVYENQDRSKRYTDIEVSSVKSNGSSIPYKTYKEGDFFRIKIGDPDKTVSGRQVYKIEYFASGVLNSFDGYDELYWNVTGTNWPVPITNVQAMVTLPKPAISQITCYEGALGSKDPCQSKQISQSAAFFTSSRGLNEGENLSLVVGYTKGLVPIIDVPPPKSIFDDLFSLPSIAAFVVVTLIGISAVLWLWLSRGRDYWQRQAFLGDPNAKHEVKPIGAHETIVVEYTPPENLRPAQVGTLVDERADTLDVTATIVDLATRGFLTIKEESKKWLFGSTDYELAKTDKDTKDLLPYEKELYDRLFDEGPAVKMSNLKTKFYEDLKAVKDKLYEQVVNDKFFYENPESVRKKYLFFGLGVGVLGGLLIWFGFMFLIAILIAVGVGVIISGVALIVCSQFMARKTARGREMYRRITGFELFISTAEKYRQRFFEKKNMFNEVLPYAIVFGLTEKFAQAFKEMGIEPAQPSWYTGTVPFNAAVFGTSISSFSNSLSSAIASAPSSSGFSGGGSGGGFGGGGGGSW
ncbi:MAG: DUF2207 domain-containing protein [bacterium]|nr:DUF2207 domain-containing protein [bacterium]